MFPFVSELNVRGMPEVSWPIRLTIISEAIVWACTKSKPPKVTISHATIGSDSVIGPVKLFAASIVPRSTAAPPSMSIGPNALRLAALMPRTDWRSRGHRMDWKTPYASQRQKEMPICTCSTPGRVPAPRLGILKPCKSW